MERLQAEGKSPADLAKEQMRILIETGQARTYNEAHQILMGERRARDLSMPPPITSEHRREDQTPPPEID